MAFKAAFLAHAPDAEPEKNTCVVETSKYKLFVVVVSNQEQAVKECKRLVKDEGIHSVMLCPGFTHVKCLVGKLAFLWPEGMARAPELQWR